MARKTLGIAIAAIVGILLLIYAAYVATAPGALPVCVCHERTPESCVACHHKGGPAVPPPEDELHRVHMEQGVPCTACHVKRAKEYPPETVEHKTMKVVGEEVTKDLCISCHAKVNPKNCLFCHYEEGRVSIQIAKPVPKDNIHMLHLAKGVKCTQCHVGRTEKALAGTKEHETMDTVKEDASPEVCAKCHEKAVSDYFHKIHAEVYEKSACIACHKIGSSFELKEHDPSTIALCRECHKKAMSDKFHGIHGQYDCFMCHTEEHFKISEENVAELKDICAKCHMDAMEGKAAVLLEGREQLSVHIPMLGTAPDETCLKCHEGVLAEPLHSVHLESIKTKALEDKKCSICHNQRSAIPSQEYCSACHKKAVSDAFHKVAVTYVKNCYECHNKEHFEATLPNIKKMWSDTCKKCHAEWGEESHIPPIRETLAEEGYGICLACHKDVVTDYLHKVHIEEVKSEVAKDVICIVCHRPENSYKVTPGTCASCHRRDYSEVMKLLEEKDPTMYAKLVSK